MKHKDTATAMLEKRLRARADQSRASLVRTFHEHSDGPPNRTVLALIFLCLATLLAVGNTRAAETLARRQWFSPQLAGYIRHLHQAAGL
jgi:hypothetical protein